MPANRGRIANLLAFRRRILGYADLDVLRSASPLLSEAAIIEIESDPNFGSVAVSMLPVVYGRQTPANGGQIDNLEAFQRQIFAMYRSGCAQNPPPLAVRSYHHRD